MSDEPFWELKILGLLALGSVGIASVASAVIMVPAVLFDWLISL